MPSIRPAKSSANPAAKKTVKTTGRDSRHHGQEAPPRSNGDREADPRDRKLKRLKFAKRSEQMNPKQSSLLDELIDTDIAAIKAELQACLRWQRRPRKRRSPNARHWRQISHIR
jgi:transposase